LKAIAEVPTSAAMSGRRVSNSRRNPGYPYHFLGDAIEESSVPLLVAGLHPEARRRRRLRR